MAVKASATITLTSYRDTQSVTRYYKLQPAGSSTPSKPETKPPSSDWSDSEPACDISKELYFCDLTIFSNGEGEYSKVSKSTSYEAAKEAYNRANAAKDSIDNLEIGGRNLIILKDCMPYSTYTNYEITGSGFESTGSSVFPMFPTSFEYGEKYVLTFGIETDGDVKLRVMEFSTIPTGWCSDGFLIQNFEYNYTSNKKMCINLEPSNSECKYSLVTFWMSSGTYANINNLKLEKGNKATDWTPAPEDVDADIDNVWEKADDAQTSIDNLEVGGRNLLIGSEEGVVNTRADTSSYADIKLQAFNGSTYVGQEFAFGVTAGEHIEYTYISKYSGDRLRIGDNGSAHDTTNTFLVSEYKEDVVYTFSCDVIDDRPNVVGGYVLKNIKLEKGNKATDWTPAPEDIDSRTTVLEAESAKELVRNGFAEFTNDPKLTLGKTTSPWKVVVKNDGIFLQKSSNDVASLSKETSSEETTLRADNARLANVKFRSANGGGKLGIVAQSNGHVSLKEI